MAAWRRCTSPTIRNTTVRSRSRCLHPELAATLGPERFRREISLAAKLQHPHILGVYDSGKTPSGQLWFTMPFVEGESLRDRLRREHQLSVEDTLRIARDIGGALDYAHRAGFVHRDIKPENILFSGDQALLADFGVARSMDAITPTGELRRPSGETLTHTGFAVGTPAYMSPEQASGDRRSTRAPTNTRSPPSSTRCWGRDALRREHAAGDDREDDGERRPVDPHHPPRCPARGRHRIRKALAATPAARYPSAGAFVAALETGFAQGSTEPALPTAMDRRSVLVVAALAGGGYFWYTRAAAPAGPVMLAVLPFDNVGDSANAYFAEGITDEIRSKLTGLPGLQVIASGSSNGYRHSTKSRAADRARAGRALFACGPRAMGSPYRGLAASPGSASIRSWCRSMATGFRRAAGSSRSTRHSSMYSRFRPTSRRRLPINCGSRWAQASAPRWPSVPRRIWMPTTRSCAAARTMRQAMGSLATRCGRRLSGSGAPRLGLRAGMGQPGPLARQRLWKRRRIRR